MIMLDDLSLLSFGRNVPEGDFARFIVLFILLCNIIFTV